LISTLFRTLEELYLILVNFDSYILSSYLFFEIDIRIVRRDDAKTCEKDIDSRLRLSSISNSFESTLVDRSLVNRTETNKLEVERPNTELEEEESDAKSKEELNTKLGEEEPDAELEEESTSANRGGGPSSSKCRSGLDGPGLARGLPGGSPEACI